MSLGQIQTWIVILSTLVPCGWLHAEELNLEQVKKAQSKLQNFDHLSVDMEIVNHLPLRGRKVKQHGYSKFSKPSKFRWVIARPIATQWIFDSKSIYQFDPETNSATRYNIKGGTGHQIRQIVDAVMNSEVLFQRYDLVKASRNKDQIEVELKPKNDKGQVVGISFSIHESKQYVSFVQLNNRNKSKLAVTFLNPIKAPIKDETYLLGTGVKVHDAL